MEPKFQSSFIPRGPTAPIISSAPLERKIKGEGLLTFMAGLIFIISIILAIGIFGYKFYLKYSIDKMGADLENARTTIQPEIIDELTHLDNRLMATQELIAKHEILTPIYEFLESATIKTVRFNDFRFSNTENGLELSMTGEARGYAALAFQADLFSQSKSLKNPIFSNLSLNSRGDVSFSFHVIIDPELLSYKRTIVDKPTETKPNTETSSSTQNQI